MIAVLEIGGTIDSNAACAAVITEMAQINTQSAVDFPGFGLDIFLPQFDPSLGVLTGVSATLTGEFTPSIFVEYSSTPLPPTTLQSEVGLFGFGSQVFSQLATFTVSHGGQLAVGAPRPLEDFTAVLPVVSGPGTYDFYLTGSTDLVYNTLGEALDRSFVIGQLAATFTYTPGTPVPEPASLALLGIGLLGLGTIRLQRGRPDNRKDQ